MEISATLVIDEPAVFDTEPLEIPDAIGIVDSSAIVVAALVVIGSTDEIVGLTV